MPTITERTKWTKMQRNIQPGDLVVLGDDNLAKHKWPLARVLEVHPSSDSIIRVATVKTSGGSVFKRPTAALGLLEE